MEAQRDEDEQPLRYCGDEAVLLLQGWFARKAVRMTRDNLSLVDDLVQEMSLGALRCRGDQTLAYFKKRAHMRAKDFLRREAREAGRVARYCRLSHPAAQGDDTPFIEGLIDFEDQINRRFDDNACEQDVVPFDDRRRETA